MQEGKIEIIGTSHVASQSVSSVTAHIEGNKPEIVAVELDARRAHALMHNIKPKLSLGLVRSIGLNGFIFFAFASFVQKKVGRIVGIEPGADMKAAIEAASRNNLKIALIDRRIEITLQRLSQNFGWKEKSRMLFDAIFSPFSPEMKKLGKMDLTKVPSRKVIEIALGHMRNRYPSLYRALVEERNEHMAAALADIAAKNPGSRILAVVGAGHEAELARILKQKLAAKNS